ncbi:MAG: preprotein translocase subunit YajC [Syntrophomonadaceae bacterium]|nr:preprotein translocase subunit YajC [Syntrophomonadaceae bacterium]MDD3897968.1 preprotein translocase subunit YajC [Syntrophomonadaceae bacterium]MDD4563160.1 preprotein translocase subunit YajC [Syntrophomonadaceae bacterium]
MGAANAQSWLSMLVWLGVFILIFYVFLIMPRKKEEKRHKTLLEEMKKGDKVVSIGGINGTIARIKDDTVVLKISENTEVEFLKKAIAYRVED